MYGMERLVAQWQTLPANHHLVIHVFNATKFFGAGEVYRPDLPISALMNVCNEEISMWMPDADPAPVVINPPSFMDWLSQRECFSFDQGPSG